MANKRNDFKLFIDRALSHNIRRQILILLITLVILLGVSSLLLLCSRTAWMGFCKKNDFSPFLLPLYLLIDPNALNSIYLGGQEGWMLFACTLIYVFGMVVCSGMLIGVITNYIGNRVYDYRNGLQHYVKSGHCVIMGYDDMVPSIIKEIFFKMPNADVVVMSAWNAKIVTEKLRRSVARNEMKRIFVSYGHRTVKDNYKEICLEAAEKIYVVGNRTRPDHDAINVECIDSICTYLRETQSEHKPQRITCVFEDLDTYAAFKTTEIFADIRKMGIDFIPYNFYAGWARQVFVKRSYKEKNNPDKEIMYPSVYGDGITPDDKKYVHLVFVGTTNFSVAFAMEAAHLLHFPNNEKNNALRTRITFIEKKADEEMMIFATRNRHFFEVQPYRFKDMTKDNGSFKVREAQEEHKKDLLSPIGEHGFLDVEFEFIKGDVYSADVQRLIRRWAEDKEHQYLSLFLAMSNQRDNFIMGMNMPDEVYDNAVPVFIRQDRADDFVTNLREADANLKTEDGGEVQYYSVKGDKLIGQARKGRYANIYPFGMDDMAYFTDEDAFNQAKLINYLYCKNDNYRFPDTMVLSAISDNAIWEEADEEWGKLRVSERWSNLYAAYSMRCKLDSLRAMRGLDKNDFSQDRNPLSPEEIDVIARVEHNRWNVEKLLMGYRMAKPNEDKYNYKQYAKEWKSNKKNFFIHHDIRPFDDLDGVQQMDREIAEYIPWILTMAEKKAKENEQ